MNFISLDFAIFLLLVLVLNWTLVPRKRLYRLFLLAACYTFYGALSLKFLVVLIHNAFPPPIIVDIPIKGVAQALFERDARPET